mgnify:CR=1 FL=1
MDETNIAKLNISIGLKVDDKTAYMCLRLLETYLDDNEDKTLYIYCDECGNWDLGFVNRELVKSRVGEQE